TGSVVIPGWVISHRQTSRRTIIAWLLNKRTNDSVRYCQYTSLRYTCFSPRKRSAFTLLLKALMFY
ncbi:hypothetical protein, partial [Serratia sp. N21D137]|uniref:hypothetical protein n=1 Tax=Serratia sp. N21D137 TaxID=3397495 RepID=UPI0039E0E63D